MTPMRSTHGNESQKAPVSRTSSIDKNSKESPMWPDRRIVDRAYGAEVRRLASWAADTVARAEDLRSATDARPWPRS